MKKNSLLIQSLFLLLGLSALLPAKVPVQKEESTSVLLEPVTDVHWQEARCPLCAAKVSLATVTRLGIVAGVDHDLFTRAVGPQPEFYLINTCPRCRFSGYLADFDLVLPEFVKSALKKNLHSSQPIKPDAKPQEIDTLVKYELAWKTFKILGRSDEAMAWLALRAAWVARDICCNLPRNPKIVSVMLEAAKLVPVTDPKANPADRELDQAKMLEKQMQSSHSPTHERWAYNAVIGLLYRRHGENVLALKYIEPVLCDVDAPPALRDSMLRMKKSIDTELSWQELAAEHFRRALDAEKINPQNQRIAQYLLAQLYRYLGRNSEARIWFQQVLKDSNLPPNLAQWARQDKGRLQ